MAIKSREMRQSEDVPSMEETRNMHKICIGNTETKISLNADIGVENKFILKWILKTQRAEK
jgi:hypothetical protein